MADREHALEHTWLLPRGACAVPQPVVLDHRAADAVGVQPGQQFAVYLVGVRPSSAG
jgi:hypothetical protein